MEGGLGGGKGRESTGIFHVCLGIGKVYSSVRYVHIAHNQQMLPGSLLLATPRGERVVPLHSVIQPHQASSGVRHVNVAKTETSSSKMQRQHTAFPHRDVVVPLRAHPQRHRLRFNVRQCGHAGVPGDGV